jgi:hypothetical protein
MSVYQKKDFVSFLKTHHKGEKQAKLLLIFDNFANLLHAMFEHERSEGEKQKIPHFLFFEIWKCRTDDPFHAAPMNQHKTSINVMLSKLVEKSPEALEKLLNVTSRPEQYLGKLEFMREHVLNEGGFDESLVKLQNLSYLYQSFICGIFNLLFYTDCKKIIIPPLGSFTLKENRSGTKSIIFKFEDRSSSI